MALAYALTACGSAGIDPSAGPLPSSRGAPEGGVGDAQPNDGEVPRDACFLERPVAIQSLPVEVQRPTSPGIRVVFRLEEHKIIVRSMREVGVAPTWISKDTQIFEEGKTSGFWIELRSSEGKLLFQRGAFDPLGTRLEAPAGPDAGFLNTQVCPKSGTEFFLEVPNDPAATEMRLYSDPLSGSSNGAALVGWFAIR